VKKKKRKSEKKFTDHTEILYFLSEIGRKMNYQIYIGKREQPENYNNKKLSEYTDMANLNELNFEKETQDRVEMIDMLWIKDNKIDFAIEVENSTNFTSGIQRASNLDITLSKIMVLPDNRKKEFLNIKDPMFIESFKKYNWGYLFYNDVEKLKSLRSIKKSNIRTFLKYL